MGELGDTGTEPVPCPAGKWNLPWGVVTTQVGYLGKSGSFGIRPKDQRT